MFQHKDLGVTFLLTSIGQNVNTTTPLLPKLTKLCCTFNVNSIPPKKQLYISLVRSQLLYCSQLWRPQLLKDILILEHVQCRATKFILNDYQLPYKERLERLHLLPLMYTYELNDLIFFQISKSTHGSL